MADWLPREEWIRTQPQALIASCVLLFDRRGRILLLRYAPGQPLAGVWWLPGGMLDHGEDPLTAARRETHEETGIGLPAPPVLIGIDHRVNVGGTGPVLDCYFHAGTLPDGARITLSPEHDEHTFAAPNDLSDTLHPAHLRTLNALRAAAVSGRVVCLREGEPAAMAEE
ncbi:NUDIX hydrolase [Streptomyces spinoverrucosus]|uniref:NUDIX hydrolase n=1 Tax=Streptomyces spinoverrucosus TaxID=284043 RepID=UPI0018C40E1E|nr:NUDIX hydrolase [Streptomyces spinoverrucosus]MBG0855821.1 NUDIX hydrolase [Streptomyces spinoverrucosus]